MEAGGMKTPDAIVSGMMELDQFSRWLGITVNEVSKNHCHLKMTVRADMLNGFGIAHGGIAYAFADSALAFASNSGGIKCVSIDTSISHFISLHEGDEIECTAECVSETNKLAQFTVNVRLVGSPEKIVAAFRGTVYRTGKEW
jgi:acyl-CoA thioesterase